MKRVVSSILVLILIFMNGSNLVNASQKTSNNEKNYWVISDSIIELYNENDEIVAYYFELNNGGYIIVNSEGTNFIEYSTEPESGKLETGFKYYYTGVLDVYKKISDTTVKNQSTGELKRKSDLNCEVKKSKADVKITYPWRKKTY